MNLDYHTLLELNGKIAVVTGASEGIGAALAEGLALAGAQVILCSRSKEKLTAVQQSMQMKNLSADIFPVDVSDLQSIQMLRNYIAEKYGQLHILINSAGYAATKPALEVTEEEFDRMSDIGFKGLFFCCQQLSPLMHQNHYGKIINLSSTFSKSTGIGRTVYAGVKAAVSHLTEALAVEWAPYGIRINALAPTAVLTPTRAAVLTGKILESALANIPLGRLATTDDLIGAVLYLASPASDFVTGQTLFVDGGWTSR